MCRACFHQRLSLALATVCTLVASAGVSPTGDVLTDQYLRTRWRSNRTDISYSGHLLSNLIAVIKARMAVEATNVTSWEAPDIPCPSHSDTDYSIVEQHNHDYFGEMLRHGCDAGVGLWKGGCGLSCPLRAAVVGLSVDLRPGQVVLDLGSGCGRQAHWYYAWFRAHTLGVEFHGLAVEYSESRARKIIPAKFCKHDLANGLDWVPEEFADLTLALSAVHYTRVDYNIHDHNHVYVGPRTPCEHLAVTKRTQCSIARGMYRTTKIGGVAWIADNGNYHGKWDPKRVWGNDYWNCCFKAELDQNLLQIEELDERDLFFYGRTRDRTYSLLLKRLAKADRIGE